MQDFFCTTKQVPVTAQMTDRALVDLRVRAR
jgi:hypothetical protein